MTTKPILPQTLNGEYLDPIDLDSQGDLLEYFIRFTGDKIKVYRGDGYTLQPGEIAYISSKKYRQLLKDFSTDFVGITDQKLIDELYRGFNWIKESTTGDIPLPKPTLMKQTEPQKVTGQLEAQEQTPPGIIKIEFDEDNRQITYNKKTTERLTKPQFFIIEYLYKNGKTFYTRLNNQLTEKYDKKYSGLPYEYFKKTKHEYLYNELIESDNTGGYFIKSP